MRNILKVKDWLDKKRSVESLMFDWVKRANNQGLINVEDVGVVVDPETGNINVTLKYNPLTLKEDFFIGIR